eukprot:g12638.t1
MESTGLVLATELDGFEYGGGGGIDDPALFFDATATSGSPLSGTAGSGGGVELGTGGGGAGGVKVLGLQHELEHAFRKE